MHDVVEEHIISDFQGEMHRTRAGAEAGVLSQGAVEGGVGVTRDLEGEHGEVVPPHGHALRKSDRDIARRQAQLERDLAVAVVEGVVDGVAARPVGRGGEPGALVGFCGRQVDGRQVGGGRLDALGGGANQGEEGVGRDRNRVAVHRFKVFGVEVGFVRARVDHDLVAEPPRREGRRDVAREEIERNLVGVIAQQAGHVGAQAGARGRGRGLTQDNGRIVIGVFVIGEEPVQQEDIGAVGAFQAVDAEAVVLQHMNQPAGKGAAALPVARRHGRDGLVGVVAKSRGCVVPVRIREGQEGSEHLLFGVDGLVAIGWGDGGIGQVVEDYTVGLEGVGGGAGVAFAAYVPVGLGQPAEFLDQPHALRGQQCLLPVR